MDHTLISSIEKALGWKDSRPLGAGVAYGTMPNPELCQQILTSTRLLDVIMRRSLEFPQLRVFQHGEELHPDQYTRAVTSRRGQARQMARMDRIASFIREGCTLVLDTLDSFDPAMR